MLVTFKSKAYGEFSMLGNDAVRLIKMMGHSGTVPGAIAANDVPLSLKKLKETVAAHKGPETAEKANDDEKAKEPPVKIAVRAFPLIEMLNAAAKEKCEVMWY